MWPLPRIHNEHVCILLTTDSLVCSWITIDKTLPTLKAYQRTPLDTQLTHGLLYNPSHIAHVIHHFLADYKLTDSFVYIAVDSPTVVENIVSTSIARPTRHQLESSELKKCVWDYRYLYPYQDSQFMFYTGGITRPTLLQYQLLAIKARLNLITLTPKNLVLLNLYKHIQGASFRRSKMAQDIPYNGTHLDYTIPLDTLRRCITFAPTVHIRLEQESSHLAPLIGLYLTKDTHEAH